MKLSLPKIKNSAPPKTCRNANHSFLNYCFLLELYGSVKFIMLDYYEYCVNLSFYIVAARAGAQPEIRNGGLFGGKAPSRWRHGGLQP